ncbi:MAG: N-acetyltransferase family protein [Bacillota bacterium]|jgi:GNAT superfamily N-acetyltransferase
MTVAVRKARHEDAPRVLELVDALADYERLPRPDAGARERLLRDGFGPSPRFDLLVGERDGAPVGYALFFETYSSFLARPTLYLEDLFVHPDHRKCGLGLALFRAVATEAVRRECGRMEWAVLTWNRLAIDFYEGLGAVALEDWRTFRLTGEALGAVAQR